MGKSVRTTDSEGVDERTNQITDPELGLCVRERRVGSRRRRGRSTCAIADMLLPEPLVQGVSVAVVHHQV